MSPGLVIGESQKTTRRRRLNGLISATNRTSSDQPLTWIIWSIETMKDNIPHLKPFFMVRLLLFSTPLDL
jgi:hypothetical protein